MKIQIKSRYQNVLHHDNTKHNNKIVVLCICVVLSSRYSCYSSAVIPVFWAVITINSTTSPFECIIVSQNVGVANIGIIKGMLLF